MSETPHTDHDVPLTSLYRAAPPELPPAALDDAIRAAARREVRARPQAAGAPFAARWQMPLSIAAVLVLCASLIALMREEGGELTQPPRADAPASATRRPAHDAGVAGTTPKTELLADPSRAGNIGLKPPHMASGSTPLGADPYSLATGGRSTGLRSGTHEAAQENKRLAEAPMADAAAPRAPPSAFAEKVEPGAGEGAQDRAARVMARRDAVPAAPRVTQARGAQPAESAPDSTVGKLAAAVEPAQALRQREQAVMADRTGRDVPAAAAPDVQPARPPAVAQMRADTTVAAKQAPAAAPVAAAGRLDKSAKESNEALAQMALMPPDQWLARIEELRRSGRIEEARAGLGAFRKRYPDYALPAALRDWAQP